MAMHKTNSILKYVVPAILLLIVVSIFYPKSHSVEVNSPVKETKDNAHKNIASHDSASESLNTLTAELSHTKDEISLVTKSNEELRKKNTDLINQLSTKQNDDLTALHIEIAQLKTQVQSDNQPKDTVYPLKEANSIIPLTLITDLSQESLASKNSLKNSVSDTLLMNSNEDQKVLPVPYYTIPANGTSVKDRLMTALVGRIPVKGVVTDPYPFKIVVSDDNLAANGLRIPHLQQMIVSGYCEGDLLLMGVRGWVTSLTFVFDDGTISTTTSNDNDIGNFNKSNSLGYLSDKYGNPYIPGLKFITNAGMYMAMKGVMNATAGAANAYSLSQTTTASSPIGGTSTTAVTGSQGKFILGQAASSAASGSQQWIDDRESQSFDAVYVAPTDGKGHYIEVAINFSKEIHIDYNPKGRKINYANDIKNHANHNLD